jgi:hypothetical protein
VIEKETCEWGGGGARDTTFKGEGDKHFPTLTVPRHRPLVLLVDLRLREEKLQEVQKVKGYDMDFVIIRGGKQKLYGASSELVLILTLEGLHYSEIYFTE